MICFRRSSHPFRRTDLRLSPTSSNRTEEQSLRTHFRESAFVDVPLFQFQAPPWSLAHWAMVKYFWADLHTNQNSFNCLLFWLVVGNVCFIGTQIGLSTKLAFCVSHMILFGWIFQLFPEYLVSTYTEYQIRYSTKKTICMKHSMPLVKTLNQIDQIVYI